MELKSLGFCLLFLDILFKQVVQIVMKNDIMLEIYNGILKFVDYICEFFI